MAYIRGLSEMEIGGGRSRKRFTTIGPICISRLHDESKEEREREERVKTTWSERISERESSSRRSLVFGAGVPIIFKPLPHTKTLTFRICLSHCVTSISFCVLGSWTVLV